MSIREWQNSDGIGERRFLAVPTGGEMMLDRTLLLLLLPIALIELGLIIFSLYDLTRPERKVRGGNKIIWVIVILCFNLLGPLLYLTVGREES
jgi:hypothetical protein